MYVLPQFSNLVKFDLKIKLTPVKFDLKIKLTLVKFDLRENITFPIKSNGDTHSNFMKVT